MILNRVSQSACEGLSTLRISLRIGSNMLYELICLQYEAEGAIDKVKVERQLWLQISIEHRVNRVYNSDLNFKTFI